MPSIATDGSSTTTASLRPVNNGDTRLQHTPFIPSKMVEVDTWTFIVFTRRKPGVSKEEFAAHYANIHPTYSLQMPGLIAYRQCLLHDTPGPTGTFPIQADFDAFSEYTFTSEAQWRKGCLQPEGLRLLADSDEFIDDEFQLSYTVRGRAVYSAEDVRAATEGIA